MASNTATTTTGISAGTAQVELSKACEILDGLIGDEVLSTIAITKIHGKAFTKSIMRQFSLEADNLKHNAGKASCMGISAIDYAYAVVKKFMVTVSAASFGRKRRFREYTQQIKEHRANLFSRAFVEAVIRRDALDKKRNYGSCPRGMTCPSCTGPLRPDGVIGATSRKDNETEICSDCGITEANARLNRA